MKTNKRDGIVLLIVLGILGLMSVLAVTFVQVARLERSIVRNYLDGIRAMMVAESGVEYATSRIMAFRGGSLRPDELADLQYIAGTTPGMEFASKASFQNPDFSNALSGIVGSSLHENGDYYILKVVDESGKLNLNDTDSRWNIDDDPLYDDELNDPDLIDAPHRLASIVQQLASSLFGTALGATISINLFEERQALPGGRFSSLDQVAYILKTNMLTDDQVEEFLQHVTLDSWQNPKVLKPTFQLNISTPDFATLPDATFDPDVNNKYFNIYIYSDFQTQYFETEARSPVCVNSVSIDLLTALIEPVQGWYLYEGAPSGLMDAGMQGPWMRAMRESGYHWKDYNRGKGLAAKSSGWSPGTSGSEHPSVDTQFYDQTRYGQARLTRNLATKILGSDLNNDNEDDSIALVIATTLHDRIHGTTTGSPLPFQSWDEFTRFLYELVDTNTEILPGEFSNPSEESHRFPYRIGEGTKGTVYPGKGGSQPILGFTRYMADALLANFNPNAQLNDHNPDFHLFRHVDKAQLTQFTTELSLEYTGVFSVESLGMVTDETGMTQAKRRIVTRMKLFHKFYISTQDQFMRDYDQTNHNSLYSIMEEAGTANYPAAGADLIHSTGFLSINNGPSLTTYPEPIRNDTSYTIENHPDTDQAGVYFSKYDGYMMLSTQQRSRDLYPSCDIEDEKPMFMAPMSWRSINPLSPTSWENQSVGVGGMMPVLWGQNDENNYELTKKTGSPVSINSDNMDTMAIGDGRGAMLLWDSIYGNMAITPGPYYKLNPPGPHVPIVSPDTPKYPYWGLPTDTVYYNSPWFDPVSKKRYENWALVMHLYGDHDITVPFLMNGTLLDGNRGSQNYNSPTAGIQSNVARVAWNMPMDGPLTPHHDDASGNRVDRVQGNLFPDGAFSEAGRLLSYPATNLGSNGGMRGAISFWVKPHWDAGYSNRIRTFFGMGHCGHTYIDSLAIQYFPASPHFSKNDFPVGGSNEDVTKSRAIYNVGTGGKGKWPLPRNSFVAGTTDTWWSEYPLFPEIWFTGYNTISPSATDFMPYRNISQRGSHTAQGFYGHQWNLMAYSYNIDVSIPYGTNMRTEFFLNGQTNTFFPAGVRQPLYFIDDPVMPGEFDPFWEEAHFHSNELLNQGKKRGEPEFMHQAEGYMRLGFNSEVGGPVSDSTYDEVVAWKSPVSHANLSDLWRSGRYINMAVDNDANNNTIGVYTSPSFDIFDEIDIPMNASSALSNLSLHSVTWTVWWPRYNWRPEDASASKDWSTWSGFTYNGVEGVDIDGHPATEDDMVYGEWDPILVDIWNPQTNSWFFSKEGNGGDRFADKDQMLSSANGSRMPATDPLRVSHNNDFRFRVYMNLQAGQPLLESPVFDDITFTFSTGKPVLLSWRVEES